MTRLGPLSSFLLPAASVLVLAQRAPAQSFGGQQVISSSASEASSVYATDLDGDGDADVLSASSFDDKIAWYENLGGGSFGPEPSDHDLRGRRPVRVRHGPG